MKTRERGKREKEKKKTERKKYAKSQWDSETKIGQTDRVNSAVFNVPQGLFKFTQGHSETARLISSQSTLQTKWKDIPIRT